MILPRIEEAVNSAPEYAALRRVYLSRIAAEWYRERALERPMAFSDLIDSGDAGPWASEEPWDPVAIFQEYVRSIEDGEFNLTYETVTETSFERMTYVYGGVDFSELPRRVIAADEFAAMGPDLSERVEASLRRPAGDASEVWLGARSGPVAPMKPPGAAADPAAAPVQTALRRYLMTVVLVAVLAGVLVILDVVRRARAPRPPSSG